MSERCGVAVIQHLVILGRLPGYNELTHGHWAKRQRVKNEAMERVQWYALAARVKPVDGKALVSIRCFEAKQKTRPVKCTSRCRKNHTGCTAKHGDNPQ